MKKHKIIKVNSVKLVKENKKWSTPMKPRIPKTQIHKSPKNPTRSDDKRDFKKQLSEYNY